MRVFFILSLNFIVRTAAVEEICNQSGFYTCGDYLYFNDKDVTLAVALGVIVLAVLLFNVWVPKHEAKVEQKNREEREKREKEWLASDEYAELKASEETRKHAAKASET